ncbi:protein Hikeshi-like [Pomacea canaliculata]|uniref:protein Hikeshi-like n=1 Tax=Pomacea canaliculata TaxID=400727 RepID=UPI000D7386AE|nr:protein Hikeshi-like [Pomacea canaliculata]
MFGIIVSGRLVDTQPQQVSDNQFLFNIPEADNINHVVVFMTGQMPFPDGLGGAVYFSWPQPQGPVWLLLGHISNQKPSAIFRIANLKSGGNSNDHQIHFGNLAIEQSHLAQIGISVEPLQQLSQQTPVTSSSDTSVAPFVEFSSKMLENFFNYASSFAVRQAEMVPNPTELFVPLSTLQKWFENFQRRLQQNLYFWKS